MNVWTKPGMRMARQGALALAGLAMISGCGYSQDAGAAGMQDSETAPGVAAHILETTEPLQPHVLDLSDPQDLEFMLGAFARGGITPENNPEFAEFVEFAQEHHAVNGPPDPGYVTFVMTDDGVRMHPRHAVAAAGAEDAPADRTVGPVQTITSFQATDPTTREYSAAGLISLPDQPQYCWQTLEIYDEQGHAQGNADSLQQALACENVQLYTQAALDEDDQWAAAVLSSNWIDQNGNPHAITVRAAGSVIPTNITSTDPNDQNGDGMIKFCFGRHAADCDYDPAGASSTNVHLPINGSATYDSAINDPATSQANVMITITHPEPGNDSGGGCALQGDTSDWFENYVTLSNDNKTISWDDPSVQFSQIDPCMPNGSIVYYNMVTNLSLTIDGTTQPTYFGISSSPQTPVSNGHWVQLEETRIYWSCLAEDTRITLADGSERLIGEIAEGDRIRSDAEGRALSVSATFEGEEDSPLVQIETANGYSLRLTQSHPLPTAHGIRQARNLNPGDVVFTRDGPSELIDVQRVAYAGTVRNLTVDRASGRYLLEPEERTFFANGIQVGDNEMQWFFDAPGATTATRHQPVEPVMSEAGRRRLEAELGRPVPARAPTPR